MEPHDPSSTPGSSQNNPGSPTNQRPRVWLWSRDLLYPSRIPTSAGVRWDVGVGPQLNTTLDPAPFVVLIDLDNGPTPLADAVTEIRVAYPHSRIVGFGSHVHSERLQSAKAVGCHDVVTRGQLQQATAAWLERWHAANE